MAAIRSKSNKTTELRMASILRLEKIKGWRRHLAIIGKPDFAWRKKKIALFVDGCFWHGCKKCYKAPTSNEAYWKSKIERNQKRDRLVNKTLRRDGWTVLRINECMLESRGINQFIEKLKAILKER